jgi:hypothetical protein
VGRLENRGKGRNDEETPATYRGETNRDHPEPGEVGPAAEVAHRYVGGDVGCLLSRVAVRVSFPFFSLTRALT